MLGLIVFSPACTYLRDRGPYPLSADLALMCDRDGVKSFDVDSSTTFPNMLSI